MIIIIDTSIIISMLLSKAGNHTRDIIQIVQDKNYVLATCKETLIELKAVISLEKTKTHQNYRNHMVSQFVNFYQHFSTRYQLQPVPTPNIRDKNDVFLLQLAIISKADFLITGDNDLLEVKKVGETRILKPGDFLKEYKKTTNRQ